ncbi:MAG: arginine--tRNA ligase [Phycisphaeraceae bacterium]|nr:arginine--tRNA ligase [Phycisphaeraceae bacterium]
MPAIDQILTERFQAAIVRAFGGEHAGVDPLIRPSANVKFGDYQANVAMGLAKKLKRKPRDVAGEIVAALDLDGVCDGIEIAGPGFVNLTLAGSYLVDAVHRLAADASLGIVPASDPVTVVVDYSSPNVAKDMHVGHLRSTVIGDCICRVLGCLGHRVIRQNHLGDWGTQFGMLIEMLILQGEGAGRDDSVSDLESFYRQAKEKFDADEAFAERSRQRVVALQSGDEQTRALWRRLVDVSQSHFQKIYQRLGVLLEPEDVRPESAYNDDLSATVEALDGAGQLHESRGARVVYPEGFTDREDEPMAVIVQKTDGGYLYATTDLAAARYRMDVLGASRVVYVIGAPQAQHMAMVFQILRQCGWAPDETRLEHVAFGSMLGSDRKPFRTRAGGTVKLVELLDQAAQRAGSVLAEKNADIPEGQRAAIAECVGIGALKYADLSSDRIKDYVFDWDRMLAMEGNTAPYLINAYVRIRSIFRKGGVDPSALARQPVELSAPAERALAVSLLQLPGVIDSVAQSLEPHRLCTYLYELASQFHQFYEQCPVLTADSEAQRDSRVVLCDLVARSLATGLDLLGIQVVEQM